MGGKHARFSPSSAGRRLNCPPSLVLEEQFQDEESEYAAEGSAGHSLAEHLIKKHLKQRSRLLWKRLINWEKNIALLNHLERETLKS